MSNTAKCQLSRAVHKGVGMADDMRVVGELLKFQEQMLQVYAMQQASGCCTPMRAPLHVGGTPHNAVSGAKLQLWLCGQQLAP